MGGSSETKEPFDPHDFAARVIRLCNRGMAENPALGNPNPIPTGHGSQQSVHDWLAAGVPPLVIEHVVYEGAKSFQPKGRKRAIGSLAYFESPVLDAGASHAAQHEAPPAPGDPGATSDLGTRANEANQRRQAVYEARSHAFDRWAGEAGAGFDAAAAPDRDRITAACAATLRHLVGRDSYDRALRMACLSMWGKENSYPAPEVVNAVR